MKEVIVLSDDDTSSDHDTSKDSQDYMLEYSSEDLINFMSSRWQYSKQTQEEEPKPTEEEDPLPIDVPRQTKEEDPLPLDIVYPLPEIASNVDF
ncbi:hypothetical protein Tco_1017475 [Tanacetum coccineum]|uniref:Uncharacterized protein n=1 Tax=Tanacetum coccineum TaxID=301880 RepID=A0ABQ5FRU3_9ASTR